MHDHDPASHLALALDVSSLDAAKRLIDATCAHVGVFKVGLELFTAAGPSAVEAVTSRGARCFLDLKLHDIPATMARAVEQASAMGVAYLTVHAAAGSEALREANARAGNTQILAVTVLTSFDDAGLEDIGMTSGARASVERLAHLAWNAGVHGFVSSAQECSALRRLFGKESFLVTPGIRPAGADLGDQRRVMTPADAIAAGADLLVVGRPIRDASNPSDAAAEIANQVGMALSS